MFRSYRIEAGNRGAGSADVRARLGVYESPSDLEQRLSAGAENRSKVTVLRAGENFLGAPGVSILQGSLFQGSRGVALMPTGNRTKGISLNGVIDLIDNSLAVSVDELAKRWHLGTGLPTTSKLTKEALHGATESKPIGVLYTHPGFGDGDVPGCVWIIVSADDEIAEGYLWCPASQLVSEHGSTYLVDILESGALTTSAPQITFGDCFDLPEDTRAAYQAIFGL
jgi:hypothetical protein